MPPVTIFLAKALICFQGACHPVLLGHDTRPGTYPMVVMETQQKGYWGEVLVYYREPTGWWGIHKTYKPLWNKRDPLYAGPASGRRYVTGGCPNVQPAVYNALRECCANSTLTIVP